AVAHRSYPHGTLAAHTLGYMNEIGAEELNDRREQGYHTGEFIGRAGLERQWEAYLRGKDGVERIIVDAKGQEKQDLETGDLDAILGGPQRVDPVPGHDLVTTLDLDLEEATEAA